MQLFVDHLTVIDCSYLHPEYGMVGESWIVDILLQGQLDAISMVMDFGAVKKQIKRAIDETVDHALLVPVFNDCLISLAHEEDDCKLEWLDKQKRSWVYASPNAAVELIESEVITAQSVAAHLKELLKDKLPETVQDVQLQLHCEPLDKGLYYHYSHGLKRHDGNCQRIAHGHRSGVQIWKNGRLAKREMRALCQKWAHIYLVSEEDIIERTDTHIISAYRAPQGEFYLAAPHDACDILPCDSTVERIAEHLARQLKAREPDADWTVKAYEGVKKGALFSL